jgi:S-(hydroxymethyl)glutathione dehydrogenase/alcohol dehydrogenase
MEVRGLRGEDRWLPHLLGHEGSGVVVEVGPGVTKVKPGDAVILTWIKGDGLDAPGAVYRDGNRVINSGAVTTFSNYTVVAENRVVRKPAGLAFDTAVLFGCALPTGAGMVLNELDIPPTASVVILGLGGVGLAALLAVLALGVRNLIAVDVAAEKLRTVADWGVRHCLSAADGDVVAKVRDLTHGGADFCIESAGRVETIEQGFAMVRKGGGQLLFASHPPEGQTIRLAPHDLISGKRICGSWGGGAHADRDVPRLFDLFSKGAAPLDALLTRRYRLEEINAALADLEAGRVFRPLIVMEHEE